MSCFSIPVPFPYIALQYCTRCDLHVLAVYESRYTHHRYPQTPCRDTPSTTPRHTTVLVPPCQRCAFGAWVPRKPLHLRPGDFFLPSLIDRVQNPTLQQ